MSDTTGHMQSGLKVVRISGPKRGSKKRTAPRPPDGSWISMLRQDGGRILADEANVTQALRLAPELSDALRFDLFSNRIVVAHSLPWRDAAGTEWTDDDDVALQIWLQERDIPVRARVVIGAAVGRRARECTTHPVRDYFDALTWDGAPRIGTLFAKHCNADGNREYLRAVAIAWLVSSVARIYEPGCKADHALVFSGPQGVGKSSLLRILAVRAEWFTDQLPHLGDKDSALQLQGRLIIELGELAGMRRADVETAKAFLSRTHDTFRPPYGQRTIQIARQCVFAGTTNETSYLRDATGNRRFWPVRVGKIDLPGIEADRDQLWAEAAHLYRSGVAWHLTGDLADLALHEADKHRQVTEAERLILDYLDQELARGCREVTMRDVLAFALHLDPDADDYAQRSGQHGPEARAVLQRAGWHPAGIRGRGESRRNVYVHPS
jgi:predicted P-loop ATPase